MMTSARRTDALLVVMVLIWGANFSVIKRALVEIPPQPFNALRLTIASAVFLIAIGLTRRRVGTSSVFFTPAPLTTRDWWDLAWLGLVGHCVYQFCFVGGVAQTTVSNAAVILGATPVVVAVSSALLGRERIAPFHWIGAAISATGVYIVVGHGARFGGATLAGDLLVMASVVCWAAYTLGAGRLMARHSPLFITGISMAIGGVPYVLLSLSQFLQVDWSGVSAWTWTAIVLSALLALNVAYLIWYVGVQRLGPARTSIYSNVVPIVAMTVATLWLGEPVTTAKIVGATAVLTGVFLTRVGAASSLPDRPRA